MNLFNTLFQPLQHCEKTVVNLIELLNIKVTQTTLRRDLLEHPNYPSLLTISDVIKSYGIENVAVRLNIDALNQLPIPFIAQIKGQKVSHNLFAVISKVDVDNIEIYNPENNRTELISNEKFAKIYKGTVLGLDIQQQTGERDYDRIKRQENQTNILNFIIIFLIPTATIIACVFTFLNKHDQAVMPIIFTLITLSGCIVGILLLWHQIDEYHPVVKQICQAKKKVNCSAILNSDASKIFGLSWSNIGSIYFIGTLLSLLVGGITNMPNLFILSWINIIALPYIIYSISYQWLIAKQWCMLCLAVQGILFLQFVTAYMGKFIKLDFFALISYQDCITIAVSFSTIFTVLVILVPTLEKAKDSRYKTISLERLKHNRQIFESLLVKQKSIQYPTEGLGITIGNSDAKYKLIKVCNPYCEPCAKAYIVVEELLKNNEDLQIQILFTATGEENDIKTPPVKHLLAIAIKGNESLTKQALDDWFLVEKRDYKVFASKYANISLSDDLNDSMKLMKKWCNELQVSATPTFFVNGYQLPDIYTVTDLKHFLIA